MTESNKDMAVAFLEMASKGEVQDAYSQFVGTGFKHHNPFFEGSADALAAAMVQNAGEFPDKVIEVKRAIAEGEYVVVHSHVRLKPEDSGMAVVHIFRFEHGRIAELWDLSQVVPENSPNQYGVF